MWKAAWMLLLVTITLMPRLMMAIVLKMTVRMNAVDQPLKMNAEFVVVIIVAVMCQKSLFMNSQLSRLIIPF